MKVYKIIYLPTAEIVNSLFTTVQGRDKFCTDSFYTRHDASVAIHSTRVIYGFGANNTDMVFLNSFSKDTLFERLVPVHLLDIVEVDEYV